MKDAKGNISLVLLNRIDSCAQRTSNQLSHQEISIAIYSCSARIQDCDESPYKMFVGNCQGWNFTSTFRGQPIQ